MTSEENIDKIKEWCFSQEPITYNDHNLFQDLLENFLRENDWDAYKEYELENYSKLNTLTNKSIKKEGTENISNIGDKIKCPKCRAMSRVVWVSKDKKTKEVLPPIKDIKSKKTLIF